MIAVKRVLKFTPYVHKKEVIIIRIRIVRSTSYGKKGQESE